MFSTPAGGWSYQNASAVHKSLDTAFSMTDSKGFLMMTPIDKSV
jgi:hypothetical protein